MFDPLWRWLKTTDHVIHSLDNTFLYSTWYVPSADTAYSVSYIFATLYLAFRTHALTALSQWLVQVRIWGEGRIVNAISVMGSLHRAFLMTIPLCPMYVLLVVLKIGTRSKTLPRTGLSNVK